MGNPTAAYPAEAVIFLRKSSMECWNPNLLNQAVVNKMTTDYEYSQYEILPSLQHAPDIRVAYPTDKVFEDLRYPSRLWRRAKFGGAYGNDEVNQTCRHANS